MAQIDLKEATIKILDGTLPSLVANSAAANSDLTFTAVSRHMGSRRISVTIVNPGSVGSLSVALTGYDIVITLAYADAAPTSTATEVKAALDANASILALITTAVEGTGAGKVDAMEKTYLSGQKNITVKLGDGNLTYDEHSKVEFTKDRGSLDTVRTGEDEPMDVSLDATWEYITADTGATATIEDVMKKRGEAASWVSTATDQCQPYCVDIEITNAPNCSGIKNEVILLEEFYKETVNHDLKKGGLSFKGRCNRKEATVYRVEAA